MENSHTIRLLMDILSPYANITEPSQILNLLNSKQVEEKDEKSVRIIKNWIQQYQKSHQDQRNIPSLSLLKEFITYLEQLKSKKNFPQFGYSSPELKLSRSHSAPIDNEKLNNEKRKLNALFLTRENGDLDPLVLLKNNEKILIWDPVRSMPLQLLQKKY